MNKPYEQIDISKNIFIRTFNPEEKEMFIWHRDKKDRVINVKESDGWQLQIDNQLPLELKEGFNYFIPKETWHRVISGKNTLKIQITEVG